MNQVTGISGWMERTTAVYRQSTRRIDVHLSNRIYLSSPDQDLWPASVVILDATRGLFWEGT